MKLPPRGRWDGGQEVRLADLVQLGDDVAAVAPLEDLIDFAVSIDILKARVLPLRAVRIEGGATDADAKADLDGDVARVRVGATILERIVHAAQADIENRVEPVVDVGAPVGKPPGLLVSEVVAEVQLDAQEAVVALDLHHLIGQTIAVHVHEIHERAGRIEDRPRSPAGAEVADRDASAPPDAV